MIKGDVIREHDVLNLGYDVRVSRVHENDDLNYRECGEMPQLRVNHAHGLRQDTYDGGE
jgi:hypothetical protein